MSLWRFDQGRLDYFQFDEIKRIACALVAIDGIPKPRIENDLIRKSLSLQSLRPFAPVNYTVWRNYKRVFGCQMLATEVAGRIVCTDLCKSLALGSPVIDVDDYMGHFTKNFYYPSPVFEGYIHVGLQIFPAIAIIKFLLSQFLLKNKNYIDMEEIGQYLIANNVTGLEPVDFYASLKPKINTIDLRQTRELVRFISQFSFLKWENPNLFLEVAYKEEVFQIEKLLMAQVNVRSSDAGAEILNLGANVQGTDISDLTTSKVNIMDTEFTEGSKVRVTHLRTERSAKLKEFYFKYTQTPHICDMCTMDTLQQYPWAVRLVELHHLLPLCSPVRVDGSTTSVKDIVGLCPTCHRATHKFYSQWFKNNNLQDFRSYDESRHVYVEAKNQIVLA